MRLLKYLLPGLLLIAVVFVMLALRWKAQLSADLRPMPGALPVATAENVSGWGHFGGDAAATQFSPARQITPANVSQLKLAWVYRTGELTRHAAEAGKSSFQNTPIIAAGSLIVCSPWNRLAALDPATGKERWTFDPEIRQHLTGGGKFACRGVAAWQDPTVPANQSCAARIFLATLDLRLIAIDVRTGRRCAGFGDGGEVRVGDDALRVSSDLQFTSPPVAINGVIVLGSRVKDGTRVEMPQGTIRAFDARSGIARWSFDPIPQSAADAAWATWHMGLSADQAIPHGGANAWADLSVDEQRDLVFVPTSSPSNDYDGTLRPGDNRHADSVLALQAATGKLVWEYQLVHHNIYDYDLPTAPLLTTLRVNGARRAAAIQLTKQGLVFAFDRDSGAPLFPVAERPVPQSDVPGERSSATQPMPTTMPALTPQGLQADQAWGFTPWDRAACRRLIEEYSRRDYFSPPSAGGTIFYPANMGGTNLGQRAYDPQRKLLIVSVSRVPLGVVYGHPERTRYLLSPLGAPCSAPPWGALLALDVEQQRIVWQVPFGSTEKQAPLSVPLKLGTPTRGGVIATAGGVIFAAGTKDDAIRAFDTATGRELWKQRLPAGGQATPMTYMVDNTQYVVIAAGGHSWMQTAPGDYVLAFALPH